MNWSLMDQDRDTLPWSPSSTAEWSPLQSAAAAVFTPPPESRVPPAGARKEEEGLSLSRRRSGGRVFMSMLEPTRLIRQASRHDNKNVVDVVIMVLSTVLIGIICYDNSLSTFSFLTHFLTLKIDGWNNYNVLFRYTSSHFYGRIN